METGEFTSIPKRSPAFRGNRYLLSPGATTPNVLVTAEIMSVHFESQGEREEKEREWARKKRARRVRKITARLRVKGDGERGLTKGSTQREREKDGGRGGEGRYSERGREYWLTCNTESGGGRDPANIKYIITFILISLLVPVIPVRSQHRSNVFECGARVNNGLTACERELTCCNSVVRPGRSDCW